MSSTRIYFDNAATSFPKPPEVAEAMARYASDLGASAGRGAYAEAVETGRLISECRALLNQFFNGEDPNHFVFTLNCSDALNIAIKGLIEPGESAHVICTATDHNSILRPINALAERGWLTRTVVPVDGRTGLVDPEDIRRAIRANTKFIAVTHGSNVSGVLQPVRQIGQIAREANIPFIVDAAQSAGHVPIDVQADCIDLLAAPGHKALMGPLGTGFLYLRPGMERLVKTLREGGTGSVSEHPTQPAFMPDKYEPGSHNAIGLIGLAEGVRWILRRGIEAIRRHELELMAQFLDGVESLEGIDLLPLPLREGAGGGVPGRVQLTSQNSSDRDSPDGSFHQSASRSGPLPLHRQARLPARGGGEILSAWSLDNRVAVFSLRIAGYSPIELAKRFEEDFGLLTRPGLHCAPHIHEALGTAGSGGTTRFSFGAFTTSDDIARAVEAIKILAQQNLVGVLAAQQ